MNYKKINHEKQINLGIQILRIILSFWVVVIHSYYFIGKKKIKKNLNEKMFHVPSFLFISFYFFYNSIAKRDNNKIIQRFKRLCIPYFTWPFIFLVINNIINKIFGIKNFKRILSLKDYFFQILLCESYYASFWYLNVLLFLSILFTIIAYIFKSDFLLIIKLIGFFTYILHYSDIYNILRKNHSFRLCIVLIIQITPVSVIGLIAGSVNYIKILEKNYFNVLIMSFLSLNCLFNFNIFQPHDGFLYQKVELITLGAINLFKFFSVLPLNNNENKNVKKFINLLSHNTGGIYYLHNFIRGYLLRFITIIRNGKFLGSIILFIFTHFICILGNKISMRNSLKYLFI